MLYELNQFRRSIRYRPVSRPFGARRFSASGLKPPRGVGFLVVDLRNYVGFMITFRFMPEQLVDIGVVAAILLLDVVFECATPRVGGSYLPECAVLVVFPVSKKQTGEPTGSDIRGYQRIHGGSLGVEAQQRCKYYAKFIAAP